MKNIEMTVVNFRAADIYFMYSQCGRYLLYGLCVCYVRVYIGKGLIR